jgi:hypothetical protein
MIIINFDCFLNIEQSHFNARIFQTTIVEIMKSEPEQVFASTVANRAMTTRVASSSRRRELKTAMPVILI